MAQKVLIVEDDASMRNILSEKISGEGFKVSQAGDGQQGLELALAEHPDLILLDLLLPKLSGLDLLEGLRKDEEGRKIPVFVLTNLSENSIIYKSLALDAFAYFIKSNSTLDHIAGEIKHKLQPVG